jgi:hypothetical protein
MFYLDCSCLNLSLGIFLEFLGFSDYFSCFKVFSELFLELRMHWEIFRKKKKKTYLSDWAEPAAQPNPPAPARSGPAANPARPICQSEAEPAMVAAAPGNPAPRTIKGGREPCARVSYPALHYYALPPEPPCSRAAAPAGSRVGELADRRRPPLDSAHGSLDWRNCDLPKLRDVEPCLSASSRGRGSTGASPPRKAAVGRHGGPPPATLLPLFARGEQLPRTPSISSPFSPPWTCPRPLQPPAPLTTSPPCPPSMAGQR